MKLHLDRAEGRNQITGYGPGQVAVNRRIYESGLVVLPDHVLHPWGADGFAALVEADIAALRDLAPEIVLLGSGDTQRFPAPALLRPLIEGRIGFEVMTLAAACRTFNVLIAEGRRVAAALVLRD